MCELAPLSTMVHASLDLHPLNRMTLSSPNIISEMLEAKPRTSSALSGLLKVDKISAPVDLANLSIPSKSACSMTRTPLSANNYSG